MKENASKAAPKGRFDLIKQLVGPRGTVVLRCLSRGLPIPRWGSLRRTEPVSACYGAERGTPVDRYYLHRFLDSHRAHITGRVLEIQVTSYIERFGVEVSEAHSVDISSGMNPTFVCDLAESEGVLPSHHYDCFLMPNSTQHFRELEACLKQALRVVRTGGWILGSSALLLPLIPDGPEYWHLTPDGWRELAAKVWPGCRFEVEGHGNCLVATAAMQGLALEELRPRELLAHDPRYPVLVTFACQKSEEQGG